MSNSSFQGDVIQGRSIISSLDVASLTAGEHQFWFQVASTAIGQYQYLPVIVLKGEQEGPRVMVTAGVHGDELNGVLAAQKLGRQLKGKVVSGTVTIVPTINLPGMLNHSRDYSSSDPDASPCNLNRFFPGNPQGDAANRYVDSLWQNLLKSNADLAIDLHTQTSGATYPLYIFADFRIEASLNMARQAQPDVILNDPGDTGVLETVWNQANIPSITIEVGTAKIIQQPLIDRTVEGIEEILRHQSVIEGEVKPEYRSAFEGNNIVSIRANEGGFVLPQVELLQSVVEGELLAISYNAFGEETERYVAPNNGTVLSHNIDSMREPGALIVRLISKL
ncbi:succinylglutamate desuccinylase/aspartoacylase family protein [Vibrio kyushuensis]|uniref:succinylglutamate desuccinylase/aspartoacylase family protein n=1 Tax=Vibrio kyushuensis TaxID=2910249 RepID=UPI003D0B612B